MELAQFNATFDAAVERSFRDDAIRTAVLIDDQFPNYLQMRNPQGADFKEVDRAAHLYEFLHGRGLICDIENWRTPADGDLDLIDKVRKSDLVVLDYQLGSAGPKTALSILRHLAVSPHFNLVVLYTNDPLNRVALAAGAAMRGVAPPEPKLTPSAEALAAAEEILSREEFKEIDSEGLRAYLSRGETPWRDDLMQALNEAQVPLNSLKPLADHIARSWIATLFAGYHSDAAPIFDLRCSLENPDAMWIQCGSCFVAVVGKQPAGSAEAEGAFVWRRLGEALRAWRPNLYRLTLSEIQNALELEAVADQKLWLEDDLCLGLGLYLLESEDAATGGLPPGAVEGSAQSLIDRFVDIIRQRLATHEKVTRTATDLLSARLSTPLGDAQDGENARHVRARELAHVEAGANGDWIRKVLPAVNAFMISDEFRGGHITTGSVLRTGDRDYWLCVSPACDLEPRSDGPAVLQLIRLRVATSATKFTTGEHIAITSEAGVVILQALNADNRQPNLKVVLLPNGTRVTRAANSPPTLQGWFATGAAPDWPLPAESDGAGALAAKPEGAAAEVQAGEMAGDAVVAAAEAVDAVPPGAEPAVASKEPTTFTVVSQLRGTFATRFLLAAGQHLSRIGVDFVDA